MQITARELIDIGIYKDESEAIKDGIRHLLIGHPEYRVKVAVERYKKGKISLGKAANTAGISLEEIKELLRDMAIPLTGPENIEEIMKDAEVARKAMQ